MLIHADVKSLELVVAAYLSKDKVLSSELRAGVNIHLDNQTRLKLPDRRTAKVFIFKLIYGGTAYGFARQWDFAHVSTSPKYWQKLIDATLEKYSGLAEYREGLFETVVETGRLVMPTGRVFTFPRSDVIDREWFWRPKIYNYPVQGTGADLVCLGRVAAWKRIKKQGFPALWTSTVHDSIDLDVPVDKDPKMVYNICSIIDIAIKDIPINFKKLFNTTFELPISAEIFFGPNLKDLTQYDESNHCN